MNAQFHRHFYLPLLLLFAASAAQAQQAAPTDRSPCFSTVHSAEAAPMAKDSPGILVRAVMIGKADCVRALLAAGVNPNIMDGLPLRSALYDSDLAIARLLLDHGANVEHRDERGATPLMYASTWGKVGAVKLLLAKGANVNVKAQERDDEISLLMGVVAGDRSEIVQLLIDAGADVNFTAKWGRTVLMSAADDTDIVEALLKAGARADAEDVYGHNATCYALMKDQKLKLAKLLEYAPDSARWCRPLATTNR